MNTIHFDTAVISGKGKRRPHNEDNYFFYVDGDGIHLTEENRDEDLFFGHPIGKESLSKQLLYGVFDGMGGESLGEEASLIVAETVGEEYQKIKHRSKIDMELVASNIVKEANERVCQRTEERKVRRMGATFTLLGIQNDTAMLINVGDSRAFHFREGELRQLSVDDTTVQRKIDLGLITPEQALTDKDRHKITQFIGIPVDDGVISPHFTEEIEIKKGDRFVISSDGLTDMVTSKRIGEILKENEDTEKAAKQLFQEALDNGGRDNITIIVVTALTDRDPSLIPEDLDQEETVDDHSFLQEETIIDHPFYSEAQSSVAGRKVIYVVIAGAVMLALAAGVIFFTHRGATKPAKVSPSTELSAEEETESAGDKEKIEIEDLFLIPQPKYKEEQWEIEVGEEAYLTSMIGVSPSDIKTGELDIVCQSDNQDVLLIEKRNGQYKFKALKPGTAVITLTAKNGKWTEDETGVDYTDVETSVWQEVSVIESDNDEDSSIVEKDKTDQSEPIERGNINSKNNSDNSVNENSSETNAKKDTSSNSKKSSTGKKQ